jgi:hypothetical protein
MSKSILIGIGLALLFEVVRRIVAHVIKQRNERIKEINAWRDRLYNGRGGRL